VRELRNVLERAAILCDGGLITTDHLALTQGVPRSPAADVPAVTPAPLVAESTGHATGNLKSVERAMIEKALADARYNKSRAAKSLGLTRAQLYVRMRRHGLE